MFDVSTDFEHSDDPSRLPYREPEQPSKESRVANTYEAAIRKQGGSTEAKRSRGAKTRNVLNTVMASQNTSPPSVVASERA